MIRRKEISEEVKGLVLRFQAETLATPAQDAVTQVTQPCEALSHS